jgi:glycosyltransferase involved in cell wall biosynthesis
MAKFSKWFWVTRQVEKFEPDIIHLNSEFIIAEFGFYYGTLHRVPTIYTFHTLWEDYAANYIPWAPPSLLRRLAGGILKSMIKRAYKVIAPTLQIQEEIKKYNIEKEVFLLPTGLDPDFFEHDRAEVSWFRERLEGQFPVLRGRRILLFAGRVAKEKNIEFLLEILPSILAKHPECLLLIVGDGPHLETLRKEAEEGGISGHVVFSGYLDRKDLALAYGMAEIFVFPSLTETQGLVTLEAMLSGTPVVAIGEQGTLMVMGGDNGGFMVKNDKAEFTARVFELLENPELRRLKAEEAQRHAQAWSIEGTTRKLEKIYEQTIASFRGEFGEPVIPVWEFLAKKLKTGDDEP